MQTNSEVSFSRQENLQQALPKQAPRRGISAVGASSPPQIARVRDVRGITAMAQLALYALNAREPNIFPGMKTLAADMKKSVRTAQRAVRELEQAGYLRVTPRFNQTNLYSITVPGATPPHDTHDTPPVTPMSPPHDTHVTTLVTPMSPEVAIEVFNISNKRERESTRTLSPGNQSPKETITCPQCLRAWTANFGSICHTCKMEVSNIQQKMEERKSREEAAEAERQKQADANLKQLELSRRQREAEDTRIQEWKAKQQEESPVEVGTEKEFIKDQRQNLMDILNKPFKPKEGKRFEFAMGGD